MIVSILALLMTCPLSQDPGMEPEPPDIEAVRTAGALAGLEFTDEELELMLRGVRQNLNRFERLRERSLDNSVPPALSFSPLLPGLRLATWRHAPGELVLPAAQRPADLEELAFASLPTLAALIRSKQVSCEELTHMYLARLHRLDETLHCVISYTEERALAKARELDAELAAGKWRGPLHGIPWGAKDLLAAKGARTTWGAKPFEDQVLGYDATVVTKLDEAGAVLIAKLTLGALAMGDVWYGETTRNPWDPAQGSSGSSAGSASATAAGGVAFAIGSETLGSIVSPSHRCGNSSLRPTFGRVSRHGAMALSWSMDKLGPICRSAEDAAIVFGAIQGADGLDATAVDLPYSFPPEISDAERGFWKIGFMEAAFERSPARGVLDELRSLGFDLVPIELPAYPIDEMMVILEAEAATAFDELTRDGRDDLLVSQARSAWPNLFRVARLVPAVEYLRANRLRTLLMRDMDAVMQDVELYVHPSFGGDTLGITNLTGHPTVVVPAGFRPAAIRADGTDTDDSGDNAHEDGTNKEVPFSVSFTGRLYDEARLLAVVRAWQRATDYHLRHPGP